MKRELSELKSHLCYLLNKGVLYNYGAQECKRLVQLVDIILLDKIDGRYRDLDPIDYFEGAVLGTKLVFKQHNEEITNDIVRLIDDVLEAKTYA